MCSITWLGPVSMSGSLKGEKGDRRGSGEEMECWKQTKTCSIAGLKDGGRGSWGKQWGQRQKNVSVLSEYLLN